MPEPGEVRIWSAADGKELFGILKPVLRVPERKPILRLLTEMQRAFCHVALVKDEFGVTQGLVTQEDILEEIVGEIRDEFDQEGELVRVVDDHHVVIDPRIDLDDLNEQLRLELRAPVSRWCPSGRASRNVE